MFDWLKSKRRERIRHSDSPREWLSWVEKNIPYYAMLPPSSRGELLDHVKVLLHEKHFEGCGGFEIVDKVRVIIAAHASCLLLHREADYFPKLKTILVYPSLFLVEDYYPDEDGVVYGGQGEHAGQSWDRGVVVLAWDEVEKSSKYAGDAYNVVLHEFAHQLDTEDRFADGVPILGDKGDYGQWGEVFQAEYEDLIRDVRRGRHTVIDEYGATNEAEFFAVAIEAFFETPIKFRRKHPELYGQLSAYFQQDPAQLYTSQS